MSKKILIITGDAGETYETLYAIHRFQEAEWQPVVAAPSSLLRAIEFFRESGQFFRLYIAQRFPEGTPQQQRKQQRHCLL
mgnify:CR=1 FL=1